MSLGNSTDSSLLGVLVAEMFSESQLNQVKSHSFASVYLFENVAGLWTPLQPLRCLGDTFSLCLPGQSSREIQGAGWRKLTGEKGEGRRKLLGCSVQFAGGH